MRFHSAFRLACFALALGSTLATTLRADQAPAEMAPSAEQRAEDSIWLLSTRGYPGNCLYCNAEPTVWRMECGVGWQRSTFDEFHASDSPDVITIVLVHGNRIDADGAVQEGMTTYRRLALGTTTTRPVRFVVWSWPSDVMATLVVRDAEIKAERADIEAHYLARFLARLGPDVPLSLIGFSFGARVTAGALHLLGGGSIVGYTIDAPAQPRTAPMRAVLVAAAIDCDWFLPGRRYGLAVGQVERLLAIVNPRDVVLKHYARLADRPIEAAGLAGIATGSMPPDQRSKVFFAHATEAVGHRHAWTHYLDAPRMMALVRREALMQ
ncbi:MAG TPA: hypothetical protein VHZ24_09865 [Pirellulales bacterium]|jgi:hypothetical protein|nr:hypothetical protein [Pirellulales bacterium]